jgi:hypothetical protein
MNAAGFEVLTAVVMKSTIFWDGLHSIISQKMVLFITTAVRTSNPTQSSSSVVGFELLTAVTMKSVVF